MGTVSLVNRIIEKVSGLCIFACLILSVNPCKAEPTAVESLMKFAGNIHQFNSIYPQEKVYLQFDNTSYYRGETIWFKAFVTSASTLERAQSKVLYVDLIAPDGTLLKQEKLQIVAGQADGSFPLIDASTAQAREKRDVLEYPSGFYEVRAYTSFMLNFGNEVVFSRVFAVYDTPKEAGSFYETNPTITLKRSQPTEIRPKAEKKRNINALFFPEGGHLIIGKPNRVAFKVTDDSGFGIDAQGNLDNSGLTFTTLHNGMGVFTFTPSNSKNDVTITVAGQSRTFSLPQAESTGYTMSLNQSDADNIKITVDATSGFNGSTLGLSLTCRGELVDFKTIDITSGPTEITIPVTGVPEGVCRIYLFDHNGNKFASRSFYHHSPVAVAPSLDVSTDKPVYGPFEKVQLSFNLTDGNGNPFRDRFCLSVRDTRGQSNAFADDLRTAMLLSSDLKGLIENPSWYFDSDSPERDDALDLLCMVQGWERYDWDIMTGQKEFTEKHRMEENLTLNGWVLNSSGKKTLDGIEVTAALVPKDKTLTETFSYTTDSSGYFGFDFGPAFYDKARFTITANAKKRIIAPNARLVFDRSMRPSIRAYQPEELVFNSNQVINKKAGKRKMVQQESDGLPSIVNIEKGFVLPDVDINEDRIYIDYFTFKAFDVVNDVELELDKGEFSTDLYGYLLSKGYDIEPDSVGNIVKINGFNPFFYFHNSSKYYSSGLSDYPGTVDSKDIKSVIIYERPMFFSEIIQVCPLFDDYMNKSIQGTLGSNDQYTQMLLDDMPDQLNRKDPESLERRKLLVDILLKDDYEMSTRSELFSLDKRITTVDGYSRPYSFYSPEYPDGPIPGDVDYRRTLYWNPNVVTDADGLAQVEFYNSSITKHFNVSAAGITASGMPYILESEF